MEYKGIINKNRGSVMVEAVVYLPMVMAVVFFIVALGLIQLNQVILNFETEKVADLVSMDIQYEGFENLADSSEVSFSAGLTDLPSDIFFLNHYKKKQSSCKTIGNEVDTGRYASLLEDMCRQFSIINGMVVATPTIEVNRGFTDTVRVTVSYDLNEPGIFTKMRGRNSSLIAVSSTTQTALRPVDLIRRYDSVNSQMEDYYGGDGSLENRTRYSNSEYDQRVMGSGRN